MMEKIKEAILSRTHNGLLIYSFILRQYYPEETVLSLSGKYCKPTKNPFNKNRQSLLVSIRNNYAVHKDIEENIPSGNAFDFASLYFNTEGPDLYYKIIEKLHLRINKTFVLNENNNSNLTIGEYVENIIPVPEFSYFKHPISNIFPCKSVSIKDVFNMITNSSLAANTITFRNISNEKEARIYKSRNFDYVTFSGIFSKRKDSSLINHSNLLVIDFDNILNIDYLREALIRDQYFETELLFISPSGRGLKWIIPIDINNADHYNYFIAVSNYIRSYYQLEIDQSGKDISRACFISYDPTAYINPKYLY